MALTLRITGLQEAIALVARWNPSAYIAALAGPASSTVLDSLRLFINVKTGKTRDSLTAAVSGSHVLFGGDAVAGFLAYGTRPHVITARNGRMLAFQGRDGMVFAHSVNHPGTRPYDYPERAADASGPALAALARQQAIAILSGGA